MLLVTLKLQGLSSSCWLFSCWLWFCFCVSVPRVNLLPNVIWDGHIYQVSLEVLALQSSLTKRQLFGQMGDIFSRFKMIKSCVFVTIFLLRFLAPSELWMISSSLFSYQAEKQLNSCWTLMRAGNPGVPTTSEWLNDVLSPGSRIGIDPVSILNCQLFVDFSYKNQFNILVQKFMVQVLFFIPPLTLKASHAFPFYVHGSVCISFVCSIVSSKIILSATILDVYFIIWNKRGMLSSY